MKKCKPIKGERYDFVLKPSRLIGWTFVRETNRCYVISKNGHENHLSKRETRNNKIAEHILKGMEGAFTP